MLPEKTLNVDTDYFIRLCRSFCCFGPCLSSVFEKE